MYKSSTAGPQKFKRWIPTLKWLFVMYDQTTTESQKTRLLSFVLDFFSFSERNKVLYSTTMILLASQYIVSVNWNIYVRRLHKKMIIIHAVAVWHDVINHLWFNVDIHFITSLKNRNRMRNFPRQVHSGTKVVIMKQWNTYNSF